MVELNAIAERLEQLEAENRALRARLSALEARPAEEVEVAPRPMTRRHLLRRAGTSAGAVAIGVLGISSVRPAEVARAGTGFVALGTGNTADSLTGIERANGNVLELRTTADAGVALIASATKNSAISGQSNDGIGVRGISFGGTAMRAEGVDGAGLHASSEHGRGAILASPKAQLRLLPAGRSTHPSSGARGDLFVDQSGRLWYCKGSRTWRQLA